jgi:hypothetical protein
VALNDLHTLPSGRVVLSHYGDGADRSGGKMPPVLRVAELDAFPFYIDGAICVSFLNLEGLSMMRTPEKSGPETGYSDARVSTDDGFGNGAGLRWSLCTLPLIAVLMMYPTVGKSQDAAQGTMLAPSSTEFQRNSAICGYTFFTDADDAIDFRGGRLETCFDMRGGDDLLILNRHDYPDGVKAVSGLGRDTVWTTDGPDRIIDSDGEDKEIRTYGGDDLIDIRVAVDKDPFRGIESTERTDVRPGSGNNKILISKDLYTDAFARVSPNIWLWSEGESVDEIDASCGRPNNGDVYDLRIMEVPDTANLEIESIGCGIGIFNFSGNARINQMGGRFALSTQEDGFRPVPSTHLPELTGSVAGGAGAFIDLTRSDPKSAFTWQGPEVALVRSHFDKPRSGGKFSLFSDDLVRLELEPSDATAHYRLGSLSVVEVSVSPGARASERIEMAAPRMDIIWSYGPGAEFPAISNSAAFTADRLTLTVPEIEYYEGETIAERARAIVNEAMGIQIPAGPVSENGDDLDMVNSGLPSDVPQIERSVETTDFEPGYTRLSIRMRLENDPSGVCVSAAIVDTDGVYPTLEASCVDRAAPLHPLRTDNAVHYEEVRFLGENAPGTIMINGSSGLTVNRIELAL